MSVSLSPILQILRSFRRSLGLVACIVLMLAPAVQAQVTSGNIAGTVTAKGDGSVLPGVTVEAVHVPTGTHYTAVSGGNGRFFMPNVRVGGPYSISATLEGFKTAQMKNIDVALGSTAEVPLALSLAAVSESITVSARPDEIINPNKTGSTSAVSTEQIETLPTVNRSLQDYARTNPYFSVDQQDASATRMYVAGRNNRYNNIQIDGAVNNDLFGLADTGTPGGQTNTNPISLDAIQQLQLVVSPYDVRQGGFTGGGVNAVTRSGSNKLEGSVFGSKRNPDYVGDGPLSKPITTFNQSQYGGRIGGPILQDRVFYFFSGERNRRQEPTGVSANGTTTTQYNNPANAERFRNILMTKYNYDPGNLGDFGKSTNSNLLLGKFDLNLGNSNQITLRHNYVDAVNDVVSNRTSTQFRFPTAIYTITDKTNSTVAQLNSVFSSSAFNEARIGYQTIKDNRAVPVIFPSIEIGGTPQSSPQLSAGTERFSGANALDQKITEINDDFTIVKGNHTIVLGTHNEAFDFKNLFLSEFYGFYYFPTIDAFDAGTPSEYRISYATGANPRRPTAFGARQYGIYASDQWHTTGNLTLTYGVRFDRPSFPDTPSENPAVFNAIGWHTSNTAAERTVVSPRLGFNWNPGGSGKQQLRGGVGIFAGRTPYVWISNTYGNTGVESVALGCLSSANCTPPAFNPDVNAQPKGLGSAGALSVDLIDPSFKFPRLIRGTLGYDRDLGLGIRGSIELLYSKTQEDVYYVNSNRVQTGTSPLDGRPTYALKSAAILDAPTLTNTSLGKDFTQTLQLTRPFSHGLTMSASYAHQSAKSGFEGTSSRAISNWRFQHTPGDIFNPTLGRSAFETKHRLNTSVSYSIATGPFHHTFGVYWNVQSGRPYSLIMAGDPNKDNNASNDLLYVPTSLILCPSSAKTPASGAPCGSGVTAMDSTLFTAFVASAGVDTSHAQILPKYSSFEPWTHKMDFHYALELPIKFARTEIDADVLNLLNMFDSQNGVVRYVSNQNYTAVTYQGIDSASGKPIYKENFSGSLRPGRQFNIADLASRWQAKVGLRVSF